MRNSKIARALTAILSASLLLGAAFALTSEAETNAASEAQTVAEKPVIASQNISSEGEIHLVYAIPVTLNISSKNTCIKIYSDNPEKNPDAVCYNTYYGSEEYIEMLGAKYIVIKTGGISAKNIGKYYYAQAETTVGNDTKKSDVLRYSVAEYLYERKYVCESSETQLEFYDAMLEYAFAADELYNDPSVPLSLFKYVYVDKNSSSLDADGNYSGLYKENDALTFSYNGAGLSRGWTVTADNKTVTQAPNEYTVPAAIASIVNPVPVKTEEFENPDFGLKVSGSASGNISGGKVYYNNSVYGDFNFKANISDHKFGITEDPVNKNNHVLYLRKNSADNSSQTAHLYLVPEKITGYNAVIFEADMYINYLNGASKQINFNFYNESSASTINQSIKSFPSNSMLNFGLNSNSMASANITEVNGGWFNFRMEYYITDASTGATETRVYINNQLFQESTGTNASANKIEVFRLEPYGASLFDLYIDNLTFTQLCKSPDAPSKNKQTFDKGEPVNIIVPDGKESLGLIASELAKDYTGVSAVINNASAANATAKPNKLVIGNTGLDISNTAYEKLAEQAVDGLTYKTVGILYYSDGESLAIAYDDSFDGYNDYIIEHAVKVLGNMYPAAGNGLDVPAGTVYFEETLDLANGMAELSEIEKAKAWAKFESAIKANSADAATAAKTVQAFRDMYAIYDGEKLVTWLAGIYDIGSGGFYYSNTARDYEGVTNAEGEYFLLLPDIESTDQALEFISKSGMLYGTNGLSSNGLPAWLRTALITFIKDKQASDGFFYHPQWKGVDIGVANMGRDITKALSALSKLGAKPTYTALGVEGDGLKADGTPVALTLPMRTSSVSAVSYVVAANTVVTDRFNSTTAFENYLNSLLDKYAYTDGTHDFYSIGHEIASQADQIKAAGTEFGATLASWLESKQNTTTGFWSDRKDDTVTQEDLNGFMKLSSAYQTIGLEIPNAAAAAKSAAATITMDHPWPTACFVFNSWVSIVNIIKNVEQFGGADAAATVAEIRADLYANAETYIKATTEKQQNFAVSDGTFSYSDAAVESDGDHHTSGTISGIPSYYPIEDTPEGSMNSVLLCTTGTIEQIFAAYGIDRVPMLGRADLYTFINIIEQKKAALEN